MHMKHNRIGIAFILFGMMILAACGRTPASEANPAETAAALGGAPAERNYIDVQGREVVIPADPQKIVYIGSAPGDLLALGVKPTPSDLTNDIIASLLGFVRSLRYRIMDESYVFNLRSEFS